MLRKNDEITVTIERFGGEEGIAHLDGMTLFVQGALPGETVIARAQKVKSTHAFLKTLQVLSSIDPRCAALPVLRKVRRLRVPAHDV